jgi:hypothetical protein
VTHAEGWWRDFAETPFHDEARVVSFIQRRGDPFGILSPERPISTAHHDERHGWNWENLRTALATAALAWAGPDDVMKSSFIGTDSPADFLQMRAAEAFEDELGVVHKGLEAVVSAQSLRSYMLEAAASSLRLKRPMQRCAFCMSWFNLAHAGAEFCSPSCRAATANKRSSKHAIRPEDHDPEGNGELAGPMAGAGRGRRSDRPDAELPKPEGGEGLRSQDGRGARKPRRRRPQ